MATNGKSEAGRTRMRAPGELVFCLLLMVLSLVLAHQAWSIAGFTSLSSAGVFPMLATGAMLASGALILLDTARRTPAAERGAFKAFLADTVSPRIAGFAVLIVGYMLALQPLGFILSSFLFLSAGMIFLNRGRILLTLALSAASVAIIYVLFRYVFVVVLPRGAFF
jgi:putative tricarboxylic transport membrane protein